MGIHNPMPWHRREAITAEIETCLQRVDLLIQRLDRADAPLEDLETEDDLDISDYEQDHCDVFPDNPADRALILRHRDRIRRERCDHIYRGRAPYGWSEYRLRKERDRKSTLDLDGRGCP